MTSQTITKGSFGVCRFDLYYVSTSTIFSKYLSFVKTYLKPPESVSSGEQFQEEKEKMEPPVQTSNIGAHEGSFEGSMTPFDGDTDISVHWILCVNQLKAANS